MILAIHGWTRLINEKNKFKSRPQRQNVRNIMKKLLSIIATTALVVSLTGCGATSNQKKDAATTEPAHTTTEGSAEQTSTTAGDTTSKTKIITDHAGVEVEIPTEINRVVVGNILPLASVLTVYLGGTDKIVGMHPASMGAAESGLLSELYPEILDAETDFINGSEINVEELLNLNPDIVIGVGAEQAQILRDAGIPAVTVSTSNWEYDVVETYDQWIALFDQIFGDSELSDRISAYSQEAYNMVQERVSSISEEDRKRVLVLYQYDEEAMLASGPNFFGQFWCDASGSINVAEEIVDGSSVTINMEQVYEWNPDVVILTNFSGTQPEDLYNNAVGNDDWSNVAAVKNKQVYKMPLGLYRTFTPGADTPVTLQWFAKTMYPELFEDINIEEVTKSYFKDYYNVELTDEQVENMYHPAREGANGL